MVDPVVLFGILIGAAFLIPLLEKAGKAAAHGVFFGAAGSAIVISLLGVHATASGHQAVECVLGGFPPPLGIGLRFGLHEAVAATAISILTFASGITLFSRPWSRGSALPILLLTNLIAGLGLIMTRDLFNIFVFIEILGIATGGLLAVERSVRSMQAGFKYTMAGGVISVLLLLGIVFVYRMQGTLSLDELAARGATGAMGAGFVAVFLVIVALLLELKPYPANGWALDVYESAHPAVGGIVSGINGTVVLFALYKVIPMASTALLNVVMWSGLLSFAVANLVGLRQKNTTRMLGYSSVAQIGLIIASIAFVAQRGELNTTLGTMIIGGLLLNHLLAKAGLFWLLDALKFGEAGAVVSVGFRRISTVVAGIGVLALIALPPFPGFFGKWLLIMEMSRSSQWIAIALLLGGSIVEAAYLVRWLIFIIKAPLDAEPRNPPVAKIIPPVLTAALLLITGIVFGFGLQLNVWPVAVPLFCYALFAVLDFLPSKQKTVLLIVATIGAAALFFPHSSGFQQAFLLLFAAGGAVFALTGLNRPGSSHGYFPLLALLLLALIGLPASTTTLQFFTIWEFITIAVFFLILRGADARQAALLTLLFGIGGAACILTGFGVLSTGTVSSLIALRLDQLASAPAAAAGALLLLIGFLVKTGTLGVHIWLPGAYAESEDDFSAINSALVSKIGIYGILLTLTIAGPVNLLGVPLTHLLAWIGVVSALIGTLIAVFQEDIKYLLAYSSMGQLGLIVTAAAMNNHLGWVTAFYLSVNHLLFKGLLWIAFAGVVERTGTRLMYQMGGLIKRMPIAFIAVLMAIIALSGVPPLSGFGGKWLLYNGLIDQRWHLVAAVAFFASTIAFLYCFRLIHTVFLGQAKAPFKNSRDISRWLVAPIGILVMSVMAISSYPQLLVNPLARTMSAYFPPMLRTDGLTILTRLGYWNATLIMAVTMAVFALLLAVLLFMQRNIQKVKQFNIVYAAERPFLPETTHYAHNFFAPYQKALGFLVRPGATRFWRGAYEWCDALGGALRTVYTGNGQTYVLHLLLYVAIAYALVRSLP